MKRMSKKWMLRPALLLLAIFLMAGLVVAGGEMLPRSLVGSGGGMVSQEGTTLHSAIGQPLVGAVQEGLTLCSGFLCAADAPPISDSSSYGLYLPTLIR